VASSRRPSRPRPAAPRASRASSQGGRYPQANAAAGTSSGAGVSWTTPGAGPLRTKIETASRGPLVRLHAAPRWALFLAFLALAVGVGVVPGVWGALCALVLAAFLSWLAYLAWPRLTPGSRMVRVIVVTLLLAAVIAKIASG